MRQRIGSTWAYIRQPHVMPVAASLILGPLLGLLIYLPIRLGGAFQFVTLFSGAVLIVGLVIAVFQKRASHLVLQEVTLTIPEFSSFSFVVNAEHKRVAWALFVETATRVSTQELPREDGFIREALTSLYSLFSTTRNVLKTMDPSRAGGQATVEVFAIGMLNNELRPFLSKWHSSLKRFEQQSNDNDDLNWPAAQECREDLNSLRLCLIRYAKAFGELADVRDVHEFFSEDKNPK